MNTPADSAADWPFLTSDVPPLGGRLKSVPEDFVVEELPAYHPSGEGEHLFLWLEKRDVSAEFLTRQLGRALGIDAHDIGQAGLKDRVAVTRQYVSVPAKLADRVAALDLPGIRVLSAKPHGNKLRPGHSKGNRFSIVLREVDAGRIDDARRVAERLCRVGFPNYYGEQRFGRDGETLTLGQDLLAGRKTPRDIPYSKRKFLLKLALSAVQSDLFNRVLAQRLKDGLLTTVLPGDVLEVVASGGAFLAEDVATEQGRLDTGETVITGPLFGPKMKRPAGEPDAREEAILEQNGLTRDSFSAFPQLLSGTRRSVTIRPAEILIEPHEAGLRFDFTLPPGVYATTLLREFMKSGDDPSE